MIHTPLCDLLGVQYPILNASMSETATGRLAAAVSNAGGFGMIGGTSSGGAEWVREQIRIARSLTDRPFGVGFISCFPEIDELVEVALDERVHAINHSFADPARFVPAAHDAGIKVFAMVQTVALAEQAVASGVDVVIAQGGEAGGHGGHLGTFALLPSVVDAVGARTPVIAAGGIGDGRGLAAALLLGAQGVWMGTRFVASEEWGGERFKQQAVADSTADDTTTTTVYDEIWAEHFPPEISHRVLKNDLVERMRGKESEIAAKRNEFQAEQAVATKGENRRIAGISAGLAAGLVDSTLPAGEIVRQIIAEAEMVLRNRPAELLG
ncbi:MAG: nitronate monooxygenase [Thermomicrobiales bacterium]|nr:nitronate monooxygenase [Thermomicrobiales bacterium]